MNRITIVKSNPPIEWYIQEIINLYPEIDIVEIIKIYNELKSNSNE